MSALLELDAVHFRYPAVSRARPQKPVLNGLTLRIERGECVALLGDNGAGKTTALWMMNGTLQPSHGVVRFEGECVEYSRAGLARLRSQVALVMQEPDNQLFAGSVREDLSFGPLNLGLPEADVARRVDQALERLGMVDLADLPPHQLSYGQRKRVAFAGALVMQPTLLVLDEPTAGLDRKGALALWDELRQLVAAGTAIVFSTHEQDFAKQWATRSIVLERGRALC